MATSPFLSRLPLRSRHTITIQTGSAGGIDTNFYSVSRTDTVKLSRTTGLVNLLHDIDPGTRFTPYIGGGVGFSWRKLRRTFSENYSCIDAENSISGPLGS